jgi:hypothetical protein
MKVVRCPAGYAAESHGFAGREDSEKDVAVRGLEPTMLQIIQDRLSYDRGQRVCRRMASLTLRDTKPFSSPINVVQG